MGEIKLTRLNKILREFNISLDRAVEFLASNGHEIEARPTTKISPDQYTLFLNEFSSDKSSKTLNSLSACLIISKNKFCTRLLCFLMPK